MYTYEEIKPQNKHDAFCEMYMHISRSILRLCGERTGEKIIREALRRAGRQSGLALRNTLREAGVKTNLHSFFHNSCDYVCDPRFRANVIFDEEQRQVIEVYTCPMADVWNKHHEERIGTCFCEEYNYARLLAYTDDIGQLNLSDRKTSGRDNFCRISAYFREANMSAERAAEAFAHCDSDYKEPETMPETSFDDSINRISVSVYCYLLEVAEEICGAEGRCAVCEGLKVWADEAIKKLKVQAVHTLMPVNAEFVSRNFPINTDSASDPVWNSCPDNGARGLMQALVLDAIVRAEE